MSEQNELLEKLCKEFPHRYKEPRIDSSVFLAQGSRILGDVTIGAESGVWFNSVVRGDVQAVRIGKRTNIQDLTLIHESHALCPCVVGDNVTVGHSVVLHGCKVDSNTLIGMGSQILDEAEIGEWVLLGAGSLVTPKMRIPSGTKAFGRPAKVVGELTQEEKELIVWSADHYVQLAKTYLDTGAALKVE